MTSSKRITEAELRRMESPHPFESDVRPLVDEVFRLRRIILSSARTVEGDPARGAEDLTRYFDVLMAEAKAIRAEGGA